MITRISLNICSSVEMSAIRFGRSDHPALRGYNGRPGLRFSRFAGWGTVMPGPAAWTVLASGSRSSYCDRPARFRGGAAGLGEVAGRCVLILVGERISAISGFTDNSVLARFRLPRTLPE